MSPLWFEHQDKVLPADLFCTRLIDIAVNRGVLRERLLRGSGLFWEDILAGDCRTSPQQLAILCSNIKKLARCTDIALLCGNRLFPGHYGLLAEAIVSATTWGKVLRTAQCYSSQLAPFLQCTQKRHNGTTYLLFEDAIGFGDALDSIIELTFSAILSASKVLLGERPPFHFYFTSHRPKNIEEFEQHLGGRLHFGQPFIAVAFPSECTEIPVVSASSTVRKLALEKFQNQYLGKRCQGMLAVIRSYLRKNRCSLSLEQAASHFGLSPATLKRKLKQHGSSYQKLQDETRMLEAVFMIQVKGYSNEQTAANLNMSDVNNFRRSFKRWTGFNPSYFRNA